MNRLNFQEEFPVSGAQFTQALPLAMARCRFRDWTIGDSSATATRVIDAPGGVLVRRESLQLLVEWTAIHQSATRVWWAVMDCSQGQPGAYRDQTARDFHAALRATVYPAPELAPPPHNPVVAPGQDFDGRYSGIVRDYSFCTAEEQLGDLASGVLPLGIPTFAEGAQPGTGPVAYLGNGRNGKPHIYRGALICAPQNSGKTQLILRWARAANAAGYNLLLIDVKGNLREKLLGEGRWGGRMFTFSTAPGESDRINFLSGYVDETEGITSASTDRIRRLATALLPAEGWARQGGEAEFHYRNSVIWLTSLIHILLLRQLYLPFKFRDCRMITDECRQGWDNAREACESLSCERTADLADLYLLVRDEDHLANVIAELRQAEREMREEGSQPPECGVDYWVAEIAGLLDGAKVAGGRRSERFSFQEYTVMLKQALEPFAPHGCLRSRICDNGPGELFRLEDLGADGKEAPVTILVTARAQDHSNADTVLALTIARLQDLLFERMPLDNPRPILLLLDETRRIRGFKPNEYITFAREAKAGCVLVYQSLDQIGEQSKVLEILENVGTQIYLDSLIGNTARHFLKILPQRARMVRMESAQVSPAGVTRSYSTSKEMADAFTLNDLYRLPAGEWPALVYLSDAASRRAFLVDMDEARLPKIEAPDPNALATELLASFDTRINHLSLSNIAFAAYASTEGPIYLRAAASGGDFPDQQLAASCAVYAPDCSHLAMGFADGRVRLYGAGSVRDLEIHTDVVTALAWSPDSTHLASISRDGTAAVTVAESGHLSQLINGDFAAVALRGDGALATATHSGLIQLWPAGSTIVAWEHRAETVVHQLTGNQAHDLVWADGVKLRRKRKDEEDVEDLVRCVSAIRSVAYNRSGYSAIALEEGSVWVALDGQWAEAETVWMGEEPGGSIALSPEGTWLYVATTDGTVSRVDFGPRFRQAIG